jgi:hypothetical protein
MPGEEDEGVDQDTVLGGAGATMMSSPARAASPPAAAWQQGVEPILSPGRMSARKRRADDANMFSGYGGSGQEHEWTVSKCSRMSPGRDPW